jgi:hypothetical protein
MEIQHARINSAVRNFVTKYADDDFFSISDYKFLSKNPNRSPFFEKLLTMKNRRMHHLLLLSRLLLLELKDEPTEISLPQIDEMFESHLISAETIEDSSFENNAEAKRCLTLLNLFYEIFKDNPMVVSGGGVQELKVEYSIISLYLLLRHLHSNYVFGKEQYPLFREFVTDFYQRWKKDDSEDSLMVSFRDHRRHHKDDLETRDQIIREMFFTKYPDLLRKDDKRAFNEAERIAIYRKGNGLCVICLKEGKTEKDALVPWKKYNADHAIAHSKGGITLPANAQVLCNHHNVQKGGK